MIQVSYHSLNAPSGVIHYETNNEGLCLVSGTEARSFLDVLELKGSVEYAGSFRIFESDLLDINNANRDRYPVSVIRAQDQNYLVQRSQVPLGGTLDTTKIDRLVETYLEDHDLKANETPNFRNLFRSVYCELLANAKYIVLELLGNDKDFSFAVLDFASKIFPTKSIFLYAPLLTPADTRTIALTFHFEEILNPIDHHPNREQERQKTEIQMTFIRDLRGKETENLPEKKRPTIGMNNIEISDSEEEEEEERGLLSFGEKSGVVNLVLACVLAGISLILAGLNLIFIERQFLFIALAILSVGSLGMQLFPLSILNKQASSLKEKNNNEKFYIASIVSGGTSFLAVVLIVVVGIVGDFDPWYSYSIFIILHVVFLAILVLRFIFFLQKKIKALRE